jgi:hypothetical protein
MWLFFRDDDLGWSPKEFARLLTLFAKHDQKLNAAAIPGAISEAVLKESIPYSYQASPFLQVVTHGFQHTNHASEGKKSEYAYGRSFESVRSELEFGRKTLQEQFENYYPCFVPPWNRMDDAYLGLLPNCGYRMLSREEKSAKNAAPAPVPEFNVSVDLHTRKDGSRLTAKEIFQGLARANESGIDSMGVMLHHGKMTDADFETLDELLKNLSKRCIQSVFFSDMLPGSERRVDQELSHV